MSERPILFQGEMVRAILDDRKTMTRRVIKPQPKYGDNPPTKITNMMPGFVDGVGISHKSPYGDVGDKLWVRETWHQHEKDSDVCYRATEICIGFAPWRPSIFMPRWASRITLEITSIRVERIQDITEADAIAEGIKYNPDGNAAYHRWTFSNLWDSINAKRGYGWDINPWCWVIEFKRVQP